MAGEITFDNDFLRGHLLKVDGQRVQPTKGEYRLPAVDGGDVAVKLKGRWLSSNPSLVIDGQRYRTGPETPSWLILVVWLPVLLFTGSAIAPVFLGLVGLLSNLFVLRSRRTEAAKCGIVLITFIMLVVLYFLVTLTTSLFQLAGR